MSIDEEFMRAAIRVATEKGTDPSRAPIGCVIVMKGNILAARRNKVEEHHDATAHAEIEAIRRHLSPTAGGGLVFVRGPAGAVIDRQALAGGMKSSASYRC